MTSRLVLVIGDLFVPDRAPVSFSNATETVEEMRELKLNMPDVLIGYTRQGTYDRNETQQHSASHRDLALQVAISQRCSP